MIMRIIQPLALACFLSVITGCAGSQKTSANQSVVGSWVAHDETKDATTAAVFKPDQTGGFISGAGNAGPVGTMFTYSVDGQTVTITPRDRGSVRAIITGDTLQLQTPSGASVLRRADSVEQNERIAQYLAGIEDMFRRNE